ncbi:alpha/beta hydrolase [Chloroflexota bacterium]
MSQTTDLTFFDRPEFLETIFPLVYSPFFFQDHHGSSAVDIPDYSVKVAEETEISCGFWIKGEGCPSILYFHGNGETVADYHWIAPLYNQREINLFVADYRGYGFSDGKPTISNMLADAHIILKGLKKIIREKGLRQTRPFIMGRSLGSMPAIELAMNYQDEICGLIIESGSANNFRRLWDYPGAPDKLIVSDKKGSFLNKIKIKQVRQPTLIIHGEYDEILPASEGKELYQGSGAQDKEFLLIPGAGHNNIMMVDQELYFDTIARFVHARERNN